MKNSHEKLFSTLNFSAKMEFIQLFPCVTDFCAENCPKNKVSHERFLCIKKMSREKK